MQTTTRVRWRYKGWLIIAGSVIGGLLLLILSIKLSEGFWASLFNQLSTAMLVGGLWSWVYEIFLREDFMRSSDENAERIMKKIEISTHEEALGLEKILVDADNFDNSKLLLESDSLTVLLNDGRTWISINSHKLKKRFEDPSKETTIFLLHPDSEFLETLGRKVGASKSSLRDKILESVKMLKEVSQSETRLKIYGHFLFNPYSASIGDNYAILTPYYVGRGRQNVPLFIYKNVGVECYYSRLKNDLEVLKHDSEEISNFKPDTGRRKSKT